MRFTHASTAGDTAPLDSVMMLYSQVSYIQLAQDTLIEALTPYADITLYAHEDCEMPGEYQERFDVRRFDGGRGVVDDCVRDIGFFDHGSFFAYRGFLEKDYDPEVMRYGDGPLSILADIHETGYHIVPLDYEGGSIISNGQVLLLPGKERDANLEEATGMETMPTGLPEYFHIDLVMNAIDEGSFLYNRSALSPDILHDLIPFSSYRRTCDKLARSLEERGYEIRVPSTELNDMRATRNLQGRRLPHVARSRIPTFPLLSNIISTGDGTIVLRDQGYEHLGELGEESVADMLARCGVKTYEVDWRLEDMGDWSPRGCFWRLAERMAGPRCMTLPLRVNGDE